MSVGKETSLGLDLTKSSWNSHLRDKSKQIRGSLTCTKLSSWCTLHGNGWVRRMELAERGTVVPCASCTPVWPGTSVKKPLFTSDRYQRGKLEIFCLLIAFSQLEFAHNDSAGSLLVNSIDSRLDCSYATKIEATRDYIQLMAHHFRQLESLLLFWLSNL